MAEYYDVLKQKAMDALETAKGDSETLKSLATMLKAESDIEVARIEAESRERVAEIEDEGKKKERVLEICEWIITGTGIATIAFFEQKGLRLGANFGIRTLIQSCKPGKKRSR